MLATHVVADLVYHATGLSITDKVVSLAFAALLLIMLYHWIPFSLKTPKPHRSAEFRSIRFWGFAVILFITGCLLGLTR